MLQSKKMLKELRLNLLNTIDLPRYQLFRCHKSITTREAATAMSMLVEWSLPTPEELGSNPVFGKFCTTIIWLN